MLRAFTERRDSGISSPTQEKSRTWGASSSKQNVVPKPKTSHRRKASGKPKVMFKPQMSRASGSQAQKTRTSTAANRTSQVDANTNRRHKAFTSLFVSFLATSSVAIEPDAADEKTIQSANKAASTPLPPTPVKAHTRSACSIKPSEIRKTRWKRFKYEMGLKMKSGQMWNQRQQSAQLMEMRLVDVESQAQKQDRQRAKRIGTA
ncbi:hypothetical protein BDU57DRAFT_108803 [Ampelomyces quisqualis]|uniref:Uncharacterized protein n=1 Tax=Ampelomyces quisqualis TaxID=50730 RepID=A0A6A5Q8X1_AMPQU|nr:hypothetical protein BDU57DRAFT_108803 [Ampelomyces quisqualis]